jgi:hypothetical protein
MNFNRQELPIGIGNIGRWLRRVRRGSFALGRRQAVEVQRLATTTGNIGKSGEPPARKLLG